MRLRHEQGSAHTVFAFFFFFFLVRSADNPADGPSRIDEGDAEELHVPRPPEQRAAQGW